MEFVKDILYLLRERQRLISMHWGLGVSSVTHMFYFGTIFVGEWPVHFDFTPPCFIILPRRAICGSGSFFFGCMGGCYCF